MKKKNLMMLFLSLMILISGFLFFDFVKADNLSNALSKSNVLAEKTGIEQTDVTVVIAKTIKALISASGIIFFALMIYAGLNWMAAQGEESRVETSKKTLTTAIIGIVLIIGAYAITNLVQTRIIESKLSDGGVSGTGSETEVIGCCVDWVSATDFAGGNYAKLTIPASRITTFSDCKEWGEKEGSGDVWYCDGPKEGCWMFTEGITDIEVCNQIRKNYVKN